MTQVTTDQERRLFVIQHSGWVTCHGFDNLYRDSKQMAESISRTDLIPEEAEIGTIKQYEQHKKLLALYGESAKSRETWFSPGTVDSVKRILESNMNSANRLRIFYGDTETGSSWMNEYDVVGTISRSIGTMKVPLLVCSERSRGGSAILTDCIVKIIDKNGVLYQHPKFNVPEIQVRPCKDNEGYSHEAIVGDGKLRARFKSELSAQRWRDFMLGHRMSK